MKTNASLSPRASFMATLACITLFAAPPLRAADITWNGNGENANWTTADNWSGDNRPPLASDNVIFSPVPARSVNLNGAQTANWLSILDQAGSTYTFGGSQLTLGSSGTSSSTAALRLASRTNAVFNNPVHFSATEGAMIDMVWIGATSGAGSLTFNNTVTSAGNLASLSRTFNLKSTVAFNGDITINNGDGRFTWATGGALDVILGGNNSWAEFYVYHSATILLASDGALPTGSELRNNHSNLPGTTFQAQGKARSYDVHLILGASNINDSTGRTIFSGQYDLAFTGTTELYRNAHLQVDDIRLTLSGNWIQTGDRGVTKEGGGTLVLGSNATTTHTYRGATTVSAGTLLVNGNLADTSATEDAVSVAAGATLGGIGIIGRATTLAAGATLSPGDSAINDGIGTLTFGPGGLLGTAGDATFRLELNGAGTTHDRIVTGGGLALGEGNTFTFEFTNLGEGELAANQWITLWSNSTAWGDNFTANTFAFGTPGGGLEGGEFRLSGNDLQVRFAAIPEPSSLALVATALFGLLAGRRFRKNQGLLTQREMRIKLNHCVNRP